MLPDLHTDFSRGRSGGLVFPSLSEFSTVYCDPHSQRLWPQKNPFLICSFLHYFLLVDSRSVYYALTLWCSNSTPGYLPQASDQTSTYLAKHFEHCSIYLILNTKQKRPNIITWYFNHFSTMLTNTWKFVEPK